LPNGPTENERERQYYESAHEDARSYLESRAREDFLVHSRQFRFYEKGTTALTIFEYLAGSSAVIGYLGEWGLLTVVVLVGGLFLALGVGLKTIRKMEKHFIFRELFQDLLTSLEDSRGLTTPEKLSIWRKRYKDLKGDAEKYIKLF